MRVLVTGGTGFVGSHTVAELVRQGHEVKLLVRSPDRVQPALAPHGVGDLEMVVGDVTNQAAVERALAGSEAVIHAASIYSFDARMEAAIRRTNVRGTEVVLGTAHRLGLDPIVHVSSIAALLGQPGAVLSPDSPVMTPPGAYFRSKADSDRVARGLQAEGAPVVITYPSSVFGPDDPYYGESDLITEYILRRLFTFTPKISIPISDVRDLARLHAATLEKGRGPRRYMATAHRLTGRELFGTIAKATGRSLPMINVPAWSLLGPIKLLDAAQRFLPVRLPFNHQMIYVITLQHGWDDSATRREFGIEPRPFEETVADQIRSMVESGRLPPKLAGRLGAARLNDGGSGPSDHSQA
jgi:dihydroflavonol-4-reductase